MHIDRGIGGNSSQRGAKEMRVVSKGGEDPVRVSGDRHTQGLEVGKGEKGPLKRVALTSARHQRQDVKALVVPAVPIEEG